MKKIIFILVLFSSVCNAQFYNVTSVNIWNTIPSHVKAGDSLELYLYVTTTYETTRQNADTVRFEFYQTPGGNLNSAPQSLFFKICNEDLMALPDFSYTNQWGTKPCKHIKIKVKDTGYYDQGQLIFTNEPTRPTLYIDNPNTTTEVLTPIQDTKTGTVYYYSNTGVLMHEAPTGELPGLQGGYIYRILYDDKTARSGHVYFSN